MEVVMDKPVGAIWKKISKKGAEFFSLSVNGKNYIAFINNYKNGTKDPDYKIYESSFKDAQPTKPAQQEIEALYSMPKEQDDLPF